MILTPQLREEITQLMHDYWATYFRGDLETFAAFLTPDFRNIGTNQEEIWDNREAILAYTRDILPQMVGKAELRNRRVEVFDMDPHIMAHEFGELYLKDGDEWSFYADFRLSTVLKQVDGQWKVWHQHGSYPDWRTLKGEAFGLDQLRTENIRLQAAVEDRTMELAGKNRELEIESALERVRSRTMAMQKGDELADTAMLLFDQLLLLGFKPRCCGFLIVDEASRTMADWSCNVDERGRGELVTGTLSFDQHPIIAGVAQSWREARPYYIDSIEGSKLQDYYDEVTMKESTSKEIRDTVLASSQSEYTNSFYFVYGQMYVLTPEPISDEEISIMLRFAEVFKGTYRRFLDLETAETQALEARIEAALERVRSRSMAMQSSEELKDVIRVIFDQLALLDINAEHAGIVVDYEPEQDWHFWVAETQEIPARITIPYLGNIWDRQFTAAKANGDDFFVTHLSFEEKNAFYEELLEHIPGLTDEAREFYFKCDGLAISTTIESDIGLYIENFEGIPYTDEENDVLKRFGQVFQQTYTRFLDLKKAEDQARQAQIEAALERVRAASMAMHESSELVKVATILYRQLIGLGFNSVFSGGINFPDEEKNITKCWLAETRVEGFLQDFAIPLSGDPVLDERLEYRDKGIPFLEQTLIGDEVRRHMEYVLPPEESTEVENVARDAMPDPTIFSIRFLNEGYMILISDAPLNTEQKTIFEKFANVFNLAYTRFQDLKKAEEQAREAQIELSLERIRAEVTAMRESSDILDIVVNMRNEFTQLGFDAHYFWHMRWLPEKYEKAMTSGDGARIGMIMDLPRHIHGDIPLVSTWEKNDEPSVVYAMDTDAAIDYVHKMVTLGDFKQIDPNAPSNDDIRHIQGLTFVMARTSRGEIGYSLPGEVHHPPEEAVETLVRFAKVFDLAHRRFEDLKSMELKNRETQIELALERIRSRAMAMRDSDELNDVLSVLFEQFDILGISPVHCTLSIFDQEANTAEFIMTGKGGKRSIARQNIDLGAMEEWKDLVTQWKNSTPNSIHDPYYPPELLPKVWDIFDEVLSQLPEDAKIHPSDFPDGMYFCEGNYDFGYIGFCHTRKHTEEEEQIVLKFATEFSRLYRRFLDLQNAEAQAHEAMIEAALERVRSRTMAMHKSEELTQVVKVLYEQIEGLGITDEFSDLELWLMDESTDRLSVWSSDLSFTGVTSQYKYAEIGAFDNVCLGKQLRDWKETEANDRKQLFRRFVTVGEEWQDFLQFIESEQPHLKDIIQNLRNQNIETWHNCNAYNKYGVISLNGPFLADPRADEILPRFSAVFEQTYTRFLDLQKAEAQAREAHIEAALERIRSKGLAMHQTSDLVGVVHTLYDQLDSMDLDIDGGVFLFINAEIENEIVFWGASGVTDYLSETRIPLLDQPIYTNLVEAFKSHKGIYTEEYAREEKVVFFDHLFKTQPWSDLPDDRKQQLLNDESGYTRSAAIGENTSLVIINHGGRRFSEEENDLLLRFQKVFEQTYIRFLDLQQAEERAREAKVEASLETVRSRTMGMQKSQELREVAYVLFQQVRKLDINAWSAGYCIWDEDMEGITLFMSSEDVMQPPLWAPLHEDDSFRNFKAAHERGETFWVGDIGGQDIVEHYKYMYTLAGVGDVLDSIQDEGHNLPAFQVYHCVYFEHGFLLFITYEHVPESHELFKRFGVVFDQTYTRFLDLRQAEEQAREAKIEASLERVRAKALSMQNSNELKDLVDVFFKELQELDVVFTRCAIMIFNEADKSGLLWMQGDYLDVESPMYMPYQDHPHYNSFIEAWARKEPIWVTVLEGDLKKSWYDIVWEQTDLRELPQAVKDELTPEGKVVFSNSFGNFGGLQVQGPEKMPAESLEILERFGRVFDLTYTRFNDLQQAEKQTYQAQIETALERVRARALAMQEPEELQEVADVMRQEMGSLGVEELETASIYINDESTGRVECWYAIKDIREESSSMASDHFALDLQASWVGREMLAFYASEDAKTSIVMSGENRLEWIRYCEEHSRSLKGYYGDDIPDRTYHLYKFSHGAIGAAAAGEISEESWDLLQRAASVFSLAYSRFKDLTQARIDLQRLKEEKHRAETALDNLREAQTQLVHAEKMASLGELTAGIAHEIKNPLNFVNNFSDVSRELLDEMQEEMAAGNTEEVKELVEFIQQNLEKIATHGQRADAIVKSMLQHSRANDGEREMTDINALVDEYLRLAYHGLRAKDKSFNADFDMQLEDGIPQLMMARQDMGRVLLNLINNAFYAVDQKKKREADFKPSVVVTTTKLKDGVEIRVKDNGDGIPEDARNKIFQPFFTTKPTGQGTGLGLSLSYDIIKAHGGTISVESDEGAGTEFIINLPLE